MIGCKPLCFFGEVPPRHERTKKKPYAGGDRAGTACRQTDTEEEPGKLAERTSQSLVCQVVRRKSAEIADLCAGQGRQPCPVGLMDASIRTGYYLTQFGCYQDENVADQFSLRKYFWKGASNESN